MPINICTHIYQAQCYGTKIKHKAISPLLFHGKKGIKKQQSQVLSYLQRLDELTFSKMFDFAIVMENLQNLYKLFEECDGSIRVMSGAGSVQKTDFTVADMIYLHGGIEVILRILFHPVITPKKESKSYSISAISKQKVHNICLEILHGLCLLTKNVALNIGCHHHLIDYLFTLMEEQKTFMASSSLLEEILSANRKIVDLSKIKNVKKLISDVSEINFPGFCRILSTAIADIDFSEEKSTLISQDKEEKERSNEKSIAESNQVLLLTCNDFLKRMVKLAGKQIPTSSGQNIQSLIAAFRPMTDDILDSAFLGLSDTTEMNSIGSSLLSATTSTSTSNQQPLATSNVNWLSPLIQQEIMHKVEILYILTLFLCGTKKTEVQSKLGDLQFIPTLCDIFDSLGWTTDSRFPRHNVNDPDNCDCTPESALKIQFLRFMHSFCDHNEKRYMLLSVKEIQEIRDIYTSYGIAKPSVLDKSKHKYMCHGSRGLITKVIDILKTAPANNAIRFWLSRAIEGFLRGAVSSPDQKFLINRGLVKHLFEHITDNDTKAKEIIQSSFDLLGEVMKFNADGYQQFNDAIDADHQFEKFLSVMTSNIVDSNMFIRCIVLSNEKFSTTNKYDTKNCRLSSLIRKWEHKIYLMYKLITAISVDSLNQENVSCLNTILVFLMFAYNNGSLDQYLNAFLSEEQAQRHPGLILSNLHDLLLFWRKHYLQRDKDCSQLEQSSSITFDKWQKVVDVMLNENHGDKTSIFYYLHSSKVKRKLCPMDVSRDV